MTPSHTRASSSRQYVGWNQGWVTVSLPVLPWSRWAASASLAAVAALATGVWLHELAYVDVSGIGDLGMAALLPVPAFVALAALVLCFSLALQASQRSEWLVAGILVTLLVLIFGLTAMVESEARFAASWRFVGFADYMLRHASLDTSLDFYFSYPGFTLLLATLTGVSGLHDLLQYANWAPVLFNLLYLPPLYVILSTLTPDRRVIWLALGLFLLGNWVGQDYLAPQALAYFLYLLLLAIALRWLRRPGVAGWSQLTSRRRLLVLVVFLALFAAIVVTHPLSPIFAITAMTALVVLRRAGPWWIPVLMFAMTLAWTLLMTRAFLISHISILTTDFGELGSNFNQNVSSRVVGSWGHLLVVRLRLIVTGAMWALGALGFFRAWRRGVHDLSSLALAVAPFPLMALQGYGGEMLLRIYLFALPFTAFYAARAFYPTPLSAWRWTEVMAGVALTALLAGFLFARYGNERQDYYSPQEVAAAERLYSIAPAGSVLLSPNGYRPTRFDKIEQYSFTYLDPDVVARADTRSVENEMRRQKGARTFLIISRSQKAYTDMSSGLAPGALDRLQAQVEASPDFAVAYSNPDAVIFVLRAGVPVK